MASANNAKTLAQANANSAKKRTPNTKDSPPKEISPDFLARIAEALQAVASKTATTPAKKKDTSDEISDKSSDAQKSDTTTPDKDVKGGDTTEDDASTTTTPTQRKKRSRKA
jgi:hypothetical protein